MSKLSCAFTGHRPARFTFKYDELDIKCIMLKQVIAEQVEKLIAAGVTTFYSGMALGVDQWGFEIVLEMKKKYPHIRLIAVRPCDSQADDWSEEQRERYYNLLPQCDEEILIGYDKTSDCMLRRNDYLVAHAEYLLAVYDGGGRSGTGYTVKRAKDKARQIIRIDPDTLAVEYPVSFDTNNKHSYIRIAPGEQD